MQNIALNYIYLSKSHAGGKDQVGLNLLKGFYENNVTKDMIVFCYNYSAEIIMNCKGCFISVIQIHSLFRN